MLNTKKSKFYLFITLLYLVFLSVLFLLPTRYFPPFPFRHIYLIVHFFCYGLFSWVALAALGSCPLRWRSVAPWVFVIAFAHAYWMEFLQGILPQLNRYSSYLDLLASVIGAITGIFIRLNYSYMKCNCSLMSEKVEGLTFNIENLTGNDVVLSENNSDSFYSPEYTIADHPGLNGIIAKNLGWKQFQMNPAPYLTIEMVCTGKSLVSLPHFSYGSIKNTTGKMLTSVEWQNLLTGYALPRNIAQIEIRMPVTDKGDEFEKTSSWLKLKQNMELQMQSFSPNLRRKINKGKRNGFIVEHGGIELLNDFWNVYARHMDKLGSVALPKSYYASLMNAYTQGTTTIFLIRYRGKIVGSAFNMAFRGFYENDCFATLHNVQNRYASYVLHYGMINHAISIKCHTYSFGRSTTNGGVHRFKKQWGAYDVPLLWIQYPKQNINLRKQQWLQVLWKFLPWQIRKHLGNYLAKWIY